MHDALHAVVEKLERDLLQVFRSHVEQCHRELQALRSSQASLVAENTRLHAAQQCTCQHNANAAGAELHPTCSVDEDALHQRPPNQSMLGDISAYRRGASAPIACAAVPSGDEDALHQRPPNQSMLGDSSAFRRGATTPTACAAAPSGGLGHSAASTDAAEARDEVPLHRHTPLPRLSLLSADDYANGVLGRSSSHSGNASEGSWDNPANLPTLMTSTCAAPPAEHRKASYMSASSSVCSRPVYELLPLWRPVPCGRNTGGTSHSVRKRFSARDCKEVFVRRTRTSRKVLMMEKGWLMGSMVSIAQHTPPATNPGSLHRLIWEACGAALVCYDFIVLPLQVATLMSDRGQVALPCFVATYWTLDVPLSFSVGYYVNGLTEVRLHKIASNYLKTWFFPDMVLVTCEWLLLAFEARQSAGDAEPINYLKVGRGLRLLRFLRLVRLLKLKTFSSKILESLHSESLLTMLQIAKLILLVVVLSHCVACGWYSLGKYFHSHEGETWLDAAFDDGAGLDYRYATSLHWSLTQFTPASMEVYPTNKIERIYNICIIVLALVVFSSVVSGITEAMTSMRKCKGNLRLRHSEVRRYLSENNVSTNLTLRLWRFLLRDMNGPKRCKQWGDVELFQQLPEVLKMDLQYEIFMPTLGRMPFFHHYNLGNPAAMQKICHRAVDEISLHSHQEVFNCGQLADKMYFVTSGQLGYIRQASLCDEPSRVSVMPGSVTESQWICEAVLWIRWFYCGTMFAKVPSMLVAVNVAKLHRILQQYEDLMPQCREYGRLFVAYANTEMEITDISGDFDSSHALAQGVFRTVEDEFGMAASLGNLRRSFSSLETRAAIWRPLAAAQRWARGLRGPR